MDAPAPQTPQPEGRPDGAAFDPARLSPEGRALYDRLRFIEGRLQELVNMQALLTKARNAYITDLKLEMVQGRTGLRFSDLFSDD
jgi:hypothetical protein